MRIGIFSALVGAIYSVMIGGASAQQPSVVPESLSWKKCVDLTLENNSDYRIAQLGLEQTEGRILSDRSKFLPHLTANGLTLPPTLVMSFSQVEFTPAMLHLGKAFQAGRSSAAINTQLTLIETMNKLRVAYAKAIFTSQSVPVYQKQVELLQDRYRRTESLFSAGSSTKDQITSVQVKLGIALNQLKSAKTDAELARVELAEAIGLGAGDNRITGIIDGGFFNQLPSEMNPAKLTAYAYDHRLDIKLLEQMKLLANENIRITASAAYPVVGVGGTLFLSDRPRFLNPIMDPLHPQSAQKDEDDNDINNSRATVLQNVSWRIFDGGLTLGNVRQAKTDAVKQDILLTKTRDMIPSQVDTSVKAVWSSYRTLQLQENNKGPSESLRLAQNAFDAGEASQLEVIEAQQDYILYQLATLNAKYTLDLAIAQLDRVLGDKVVILDEASPKREAVAGNTP